MFSEKNPRKILSYRRDLPESFLERKEDVAVDTEAMGLNHHRDRLCLVQLSWGDGVSHLVHIEQDQTKAPVLSHILTNPSVTKIFHFARFDMGILWHNFGALARPIYCTRSASKVARTYTEKHGLKDLCRSLLSLEISKEAQCSDWGNDHLTEAQKMYGSKDVIYLHSLRHALNQLLVRENRTAFAQAAFEALPHRVILDSAGYPDNFFDYSTGHHRP